MINYNFYGSSRKLENGAFNLLGVNNNFKEIIGDIKWAFLKRMNRQPKTRCH